MIIVDLLEVDIDVDSKDGTTKANNVIRIRKLNVE